MTRCLHSEITRDGGPDITDRYSKRKIGKHERVHVRYPLQRTCHLYHGYKRDI